MSNAERERRHHANLDQINRVQLIVGRGDRMRVDHEGTLLERARMTGEELSSYQATELGLAAFSRLLRHAEDRDSPHARDVREFIGAVRGNRLLPLATLRGVTQDIGDDMLAVLDAFRYARLNLAEQVEGGPVRVAKVLDSRSKAGA
ncbi:MAG: hypothetical protein ABWZ08_14350 [Pseudoxanthomonas sp.]